MIDEINFNFAEIRRSSTDAVAAMREAAEELTRLQAENSALRQELTTAQARIVILEGRLRERPWRNIHGDEVGECDVCGKSPRVLTHAIACGIETYACAECRGNQVCEACGDDRAMCGCGDIELDRESPGGAGPGP